MLIFYGCAANLETTVYTDGVVKIKSEYLIDNCSTDEFSKKTTPDTISEHNYTDIRRVNFFTIDGYNPKNSMYINCLQYKLVSEYDYTKDLAMKLIKHITYYQYIEGTLLYPGGVITEWSWVPDPDMPKVYKWTSPRGGVWETSKKYEKKYIGENKPSRKDYIQSVIGVDIDTVDYDNSFTRIGFFFNQSRTGEGAIFVSDIIRNEGFDGVYGEIKVNQNITVLNAVHYGVPFIASAIPIIQIESGEWGRGTKPNPLMYIPIAIMTYFATNWLLNIFVPDESSITVEMTMARLKNDPK
ncbi:MAG: hypothetical protein IH618_15715 [Ignavibacteriaceae bacterium]|nr:hypothetical protein [Ignavibacteriaceae bacterium]